jgi:1-acyl-sn-glycerol-3-phosphate acyltransferase
LKLIFIFFGRLKAYGQENVPATGPIILAPNHISFADPPCVGAGMKRHVHFMAKEELFPPGFGNLLKTIGTFPVKRGTADRRAIKTATALLDQGRVVCIFPEGRRSPNGELQKSELGIGMIALKSKAPVVPALVLGTDKVLPFHSKFFHFHPIKVIYGKPITFPDLYDSQNTREAVEEIGRRVMHAIGELQTAARQA